MTLYVAAEGDVQKSDHSIPLPRFPP
ncbi:hypothetical protein XAP6164_1310003 [Xanthomonas phaseoli pv. phaseoli]|nr:hypothetical protein XAP6164_1310003 [Xanthomonas phaseoli pv. phaseoli]